MNLALAPSLRLARRARDLRPGLVVVLATIALLLVVGRTASDRFGTSRNLLNVYEQSAALVPVSVGQTIVVLTGGIDLSVGSAISLLSELTSGLIDGRGSLMVPVAVGVVLLGLLIGAVNGACVVLLRVHPLVVTLGTGAALQGLTLLYSSRPPGRLPDSFSEIAYGRVAGIPIGASLGVLLVVLTALALHSTRLGRYVYAIGGSEPAARALGLPRNRVLPLVYALCGASCGITAILLVSRFGVGQPYAGYNMTLGSITPVVVGGTVLSGGRGGVFGTLVGVYFIGLLYNVLNFVGIPTQWQLAIQGMVVILAVSLQAQARKSP